MNKNELVAAIAEKADLTKADAGKALDAITDAITEDLKQGEEVRLLGFGTFYVSRSEARDGRNPRTGETIKIKASNQPKFRAGKGLKEALN